MKLQIHGSLNDYVEDRAKEICPDVRWSVPGFNSSSGLALLGFAPDSSATFAKAIVDVQHGIDAGLTQAVKEILKKLEQRFREKIVSDMALLSQLSLLNAAHNADTAERGILVC